MANSIVASFDSNPWLRRRGTFEDRLGEFNQAIGVHLSDSLLDHYRQMMCEAAMDGGVQPWQISFKSTMTTLTDMLPVLGMIRDPDKLCRVLLRCCRQHIVGNQPNRYEPRVLKRRPKPYKLMQKPRSEYKPGEA